MPNLEYDNFALLRRKILHDNAAALYGLTANSEITPEVRCVLEIVIDGLTEADVGAAMRVGMQACITIGASGGLRRVSAGNYGGKLGPYHFHLHKLLGADGGPR